MADFPISPKDTAMLFFDALNIYWHPENPETRAIVDASGVVPAMRRIHKACREAGMPIFYSQADHRADGKDFAAHLVDHGSRGDTRPRPHFTTPPAVAAGSADAEIIPEIAPQPSDYVVKKHRWSSFFQTHLQLSLRTAGIRTIMIAGGATEVGVASTAYSARDRDFSLIILRDACRSMNPGVNEVFMDQIFPVFARVMTVDEVVSLISKE